MTSSETVDLSIIVPMFNEEECIERFLEEVYSELRKLDQVFEVVVVDDCSTDSTTEILGCLEYENLQVIHLPNNFGHSYAIWKGLCAARGDLLLTLDGDLQHPPSLIPLMIDELLHSDSDITYGIRKDFNSERVQKRFSSHVFYLVCNYLYGVQLEPFANDFRLIKTDVMQHIKVKRGQTPVLRAILPSLHLKTSFVEYELGPRFAGVSKFTFIKMLELFLNTASYATKSRKITLTIVFVVFTSLTTINISVIYGALVLLFSIVLATPFFSPVLFPYLIAKKKSWFAARRTYKP
jgi:glycosyltransferase involved in cell wall biosynthesis